MESKYFREIAHLVTYVVAIIATTIAVNSYLLSPVNNLEQRVAVIEHEHILYRDDVLQRLGAIDQHLSKTDDILTKLLLK